MDPRGTVGRICKEEYYTLLHTKYESSRPYGFREEDIFHYKPMSDNDAPGAGPVWTPGAQLAGFIKRTTINCYTQNMKALDLVVSEKNFFSHDTPPTPPGWGLYRPQGHGCQDL